MIEKKVESLSVRFDQPTLEALKERAMIEDRSPSDLVRRAVSLYLYGVMGVVNHAPEMGASDNVGQCQTRPANGARS